MTQQPLPTALPTDNTPKTYSGTLLTAYLLLAGQTTLVTGTVTTGGTLTAAAATTITVTALPVALPSGTVLDFGGVKATLTAAAAASATALTVSALSASIPAGATAAYQNFDEIPLAEDFAPTLTDDEETVKVHGRITPIRTVNGKDLTAMVKTVAAIDDPVIKRLVILGTQISPGNRARLIFKYADGFAILATVNIGSPKPTGAVGSTQRYEFSGNLAGKMFWADLNETTPQWYPIGTLAVPTP
ncbi:hypothetical protein [Deinococcus alpinitundrae]|uniref:hypothetical protein n=1 Tax=Deinococcus alpinitundrae TaxID=468913 RepID=UPI001379EBB9|nr:hypothetical protein [Deinococcus alpinitundrae]